IRYRYVTGNVKGQVEYSVNVVPRMPSSPDGSSRGSRCNATGRLLMADMETKTNFQVNSVIPTEVYFMMNRVCGYSVPSESSDNGVAGGICR
ncbi:hypothetical protein NEUTE2DRAFT_75426, partial [Neurospora tetrasperma FGSC 2509]